MQTLFDVSQKGNDAFWLNWLFAHLIRHAERYTKIEYKRVFKQHEKAFRLVEVSV